MSAIEYARGLVGLLVFGIKLGLVGLGILMVLSTYVGACLLTWHWIKSPKPTPPAPEGHRPRSAQQPKA